MKPLWVLTVAVLVFGACIDTRERPVTATESGGSPCQDHDGDGYGEGCALGGDCNDRDRSVHVGCVRCASPEQGCTCEGDAKPVSCYREPTTLDGTVMCHEGTRYCRDGVWSGCEGVVSYPKPEELETQAIVDPTAATQHCNDCSINCFVIRDNLDPVDAGLNTTSTNITNSTRGGLTLTASVPDGGTTDAGRSFDPSQCVLGTAPDQDCDGIPDVYDPYPNQKPFATANPTIFLDIAPGETGTGVVNLQFYLNSADIYFLVDQTGSMAGERDQLKSDLVTGDFINDASYNCADYDFDYRPNNELKTQGIIGAVRCMIRDANFGVGFFREIPLPTYANSDNVTYRNLQDISASIPSVTSAVSKLTTVGNIDWPEASMLGLYAVATGNGYYFGVDRTALAPRTDCPSRTFGYPCFRTNAIPIVVMFTDAQLHQGPSTNTRPYDPTKMGINLGSATAATPVTPTNETFASALDLGDLTNAYVTLVGNTTSMVSNLDSSLVTCGTTDDDAPDAMFKFSLTATKTLTASTFGSDFDTTLSIFNAVPATATSLPSYPNTNDTASSAYAFDTVNSRYVLATGNSSTLRHDYSANDVGCAAAATGNDATFTFNLNQATRVALSTAGSSYNATVALFSGAPAQVSYTTVPNTNDTISAPYAVGTLNGRNLGFSGDTSAAGITANYTASQLRCSSPPADAARDAVYEFSLSAPTRVRVSAEDSALDTVVALTGASGSFVGTTAAGTSNETATSAYNIGVLDNAAFQFSGNTSGMVADYSSSLIGCGTSSASKDAVFKFTLAAAQTVDIDTRGSGFDTALALFRNSVSAASTSVDASADTNDTAATALNLGTLNAKSFTTSGASTRYLNDDYTNTQVSCGSNTSSPDAVYRFHLDSATRVHVDTIGSTFDAVASLHTAGSPQTITTLPSTSNEAVASAYAVSVASSTAYQSFDSSTSSMTADVAIDNGSCFADPTGRDAVFRVTVASEADYQLDTIGSTFDTVLGLYPSTVLDGTIPAATAKGSAGDTKAGAVSVGTIDTKWLSYSGSTATLANNNSFNNCSAKSSSPDVYYQFSVGTRRTVIIDTEGSSFDTVLALTTSADAQIACDNDSGSGTASKITATLDPGTYYVFIKTKGSSSGGAYQLTFRDATTYPSTNNMLACDDDSGGSRTSMLTVHLTAGTYYAVVKGYSSSSRGSYRLTVKDLTALDLGTRLTCDNNSAGSSQAQFETDLSAGDYYIVVKGASSSAMGGYTLRVYDVTDSSGFVTCNDNDTAVTTSRVTQSLAAGTYYVVVKGLSTSGGGAYTLSLRDSDVTTTTAYACDYDSGPSGTSFIEQNLAAGTYRVFVKGKAATDAGSYKLVLRDVTGVPTNQLSCNGSGTGAAYLEQTLAAGTYTVVMQSNTSGSSGAYQLSVRDVTQVPIAGAPYCNNDTTSSVTSKLTPSLTAGTYYALVKGNRTANHGVYQLNIGAKATTTGTFVPPTWAQTQAALNANSIRVMSVLSCHDDPNYGDAAGDCGETRTQARALANATGALGSTLQPLVFDIDGDGSGLSKTVVDGIGELADYLEMNVSVRVVFDPDPNPGFGLTVRAVDAPGDGCSGLLGLEHQRCIPGATPRFELAFDNPLARPVPANPNDPNGGYNFRAELIGDQQFIVDRVPIYIVPRDVSPPPPAPVYAASGAYWQDVSSPGCFGTQRPDWHDLTWNANLPNGTKITFGVCAGDDPKLLNSCTPTPLCTVTGGGPCVSDSDCSDGYCSSSRNCHFITAGSCTSDDDCITGASCRSGTCRFGGQPVYIGDALANTNYTSNLRVQVGLVANTSANTAPTVYDWALTYLCNSAQ